MHIAIQSLQRTRKRNKGNHPTCIAVNMPAGLIAPAGEARNVYVFGIDSAVLRNKGSDQSVCIISRQTCLKACGLGAAEQAMRRSCTAMRILSIFLCKLI